MSEAARRAGVSLAAPYRHFADKADLLASVAEQGFLELTEASAAAGHGISDPRARLTNSAVPTCAGPSHIRITTR